MEHLESKTGTKVLKDFSVVQYLIFFLITFKFLFWNNLENVTGFGKYTTSKIISLAGFNIHDQYKASEKHLSKIKHTDLGIAVALTKTSSQQGELSPIRAPNYSNQPGEITGCSNCLQDTTQNSNLTNF